MWDAATGAERATLTGHTGAVSGCAISPDGRFIVSAGGDKTLKVWDAATGLERASLPLLGALRGLALHPWSPFAACGEDGGMLYMVDLMGIEYGPLIVTAVDCGSGPALCCPVCRHTFQLRNDWLGREITCPNPDCSTPLQVNPFVAGRPQTGSAETKALPPEDVRAEPGRGAEPRILAGHRDKVTAVAVTPDGRWAVSGSADRTVRVWDLLTGEEVQSLSGHEDAVLAVAVTPDGQRAVSVSKDGRMRMWDLERGVALQRMRDAKPVRVAALAKAGQRAVVTGNGVVRVWNLEERSGWRALIGNIGRIAALAVTPDGRWAALGSEDGKFLVLDLAREAAKREVLGVACHDPVRAVALTADGRRALCADEDCTVRVWDPEQRTQLHVLRGHTAPAAALAVTADGRRVVSASEDGTLMLWDLEQGELMTTVRRERRFSSCAIAPDGLTVVAGDESGQVHIVPLEGSMMQQASESEVAGIPEDKRSAAVDELKERGAGLLDAGSYEQAIECFNEALRLKPDDVELVFYSLTALLRAGRNHEALARADDGLERQLVSGENLGYLYAAKANALVGLERHKQALPCYQKALAIVQDDHNIWFWQASALSPGGEYQKALATLTKARSLKDEARTSIRIGYCLLHLERYSDAEEEFSALISQGSQDPLAFHGIGLAKIHTGKQEEACAHLEKFIDLAGPEHAALVAEIREILDRL